MRDLYTTALPWLKEFMQTWQDYPIVDRFTNSESVNGWLMKSTGHKSLTPSPERSHSGNYHHQQNLYRVFGLAAELVIMSLHCSTS